MIDQIRTYTRYLIVAAMLFIARGEADARAPLLQTERWQENSRGVSLRPPENVKLVEGGAKEPVLRILGDVYAMSLEIKARPKPFTIGDLYRAALNDIALIDPKATLESQSVQVGNREGTIVYFRRTSPQDRQWIDARAYVQIDPSTHMVLRLKVQDEHFPRVKPIYEAVLKSVQLADPKELDQQRAEQIENSVSWRRNVDLDRLLAALIPEQWLRIQQGDDEKATDVGYLVIRHRRDKQMSFDGLRVDVQGRIHLGEKVFDTLSHFFLSEDREREFWSIKTTVRQTRPLVTHDAQKPKQEVSWAETGVRSTDQITLSIEGPSGHKQYQWKRPPEGYVSQVELYLLGRLLPHEKEQTFGFYAYHSSVRKITYRAERVVPAPDRTFRIYSRPTLEQGEQVTRYDRHGRLLKRVLPGGRIMLPASPSELGRIWQITDLMP